MPDLRHLITSIDWTPFIGICLIGLWVLAAVANEIAKHGQHQEPRRTAPVSSARKAGRRSV